MAPVGRALAVAGAAALLAAGSFAAASGGRVLARAGTVEILVEQVERQIKRAPLFQLRQMGGDPDAVRRAFLDEIVRQELLALAASTDGLDQLPEVQDQIRERLIAELRKELQSEILAKATISDDEVSAHYEKNKQSYQPEQRLKLWYVLLDSREEALGVLDVVRSDPEFQKDPVGKWDEIARTRSKDSSNKMRKGNLGFVQPDGTTANRDVRVNPVLYQAAEKVKDGEIVPEPIADGRHFAVVWRRGSLITPLRTLAMEAPNIRATLAKQKVLGLQRELRDQLRSRYVTEQRPELVDSVEVSKEGDVASGRRPGGLARHTHAAAGSPRPAGPPGYLR